jgi:LuxR family maltose regulon positive regulatory protein
MKSTQAHNPESLLHTKLMPPRLPSAVIQRDELLARLDNGLTRKVSLVTAPTGFGKTTLVRLWTAGGAFASAWVTLDENDNDPVRFWTYVCSALRTLDRSLGKTSLSMLARPQPPPFESLLTPLINDLARLVGPCVLVLEDYHVVRSTEIHQGVSFLIQHLPEQSIWC